MSGKLRILVAASTFPRYGGDNTPRFILDLCKSLQTAGECTCTVLAPHANGSRVIEEVEGVKVLRYRYIIPSSLEKLSRGGIVSIIKRNKVTLLVVPFFLAGQFFATVRAVKRLKPDLVLSNWIVPQGIVAALIKIFVPGLKIIVVSHGGDSAFIQGNFIFRLMGKFALRKADKIVAVSSFIKERISYVSGVAADMIAVAPMGVNNSLFKPAERDNSQKSSLLFVGRLEEKKGLVYLIEAMTEVLQSYPDAFLKIVGDGTQKTRLQRLASEKGLAERVVFVGAVEHSRLPGFFEESTVFVAPSVNLDDDVEGLPVVLLESMAAGVPVITTDAGGITDIIESGVTGIVVPQRDPVRLARGIMRLLEDENLRKDISLRASATLRERFTWEAVAKRYIGIIRDVCGITAITEAE